MLKISVLHLLIAYSLSSTLACSNSSGQYVNTSLSPANEENTDGDRPSVDPNTTLESSPLNFVLEGQQPRFGEIASSLSGTCDSNRAKTVKIVGDLVGEYEASCSQGRFSIANVRFSAGSGTKELRAIQANLDGSSVESKPLLVNRDDETFFSYPENAVAPAATLGLRGRKISDLFFVGNLIVVTHNMGGISISRDNGKSWFSKTSAHGLTGEQVHLDYVNGRYISVSKDRLFSSSDSGKYWSAVDLDGFVATHRRGSLLFMVPSIYNFGSVKVSEDNGKTFTMTEPIPGEIGSTRRFFSTEKQFFVATADGVFEYQDHDRNWKPFTFEGLPEDWATLNIGGDGNSYVALACQKPISPDTKCSFYVGENNFENFSKVHSGLYRTFCVEDSKEINMNSSSFLLSPFGKSIVRRSKSGLAVETFVTSNNNQFWEALSLPPNFLTPNLPSETMFYNSFSTLVLRNAEKFAVSTVKDPFSWRTFELPESLSNSNLLRIRNYQEQLFLVFEDGLLFTDGNFNKWNYLALSNKARSFEGIHSFRGKIFGWGKNSTTTGLYESVDGGVSFSNITSHLDKSGLVTEKAVLKVVSSGQHLFVSTSDGVFVSSDLGQSFELLQGEDGRPNPIAEDIYSEGDTVAIAFKGNGLLLKTGSSKGWYPITQASGLPDNNVESVSIINGSIVAVFKNGKVAISNDDGINWDILKTPEELANETLFKIRMSKGAFLYQADSTPMRSWISSDSGSSLEFVETNEKSGSDTKHPFALLSSESGIYVGSHAAVNFLRKSTNKWESWFIDTPTPPSQISEISSALYVVTPNGLKIKSPTIPVSLDEVRGTQQLASEVTLKECLPSCTSTVPVTDGNSESPGSSVPPSASQIDFTLGECTFSNLGKCVLDVSWEGAPRDSCLWISVGGMPPVLSECSLVETPFSAKLKLNHLKPGPDKVYTFYLARERIDGFPDKIYAQKSLSIQTELNISQCDNFKEWNCDAQVSWKNAPANSCLWAQNPLTHQIWLAGCALEGSPNAHQMNFEWIFYGEDNIFFLARQSADPNVPLNEKFAQVIVNEAPPAGFTSYDGMAGFICPASSCQYAVKGYIDEIFEGHAKGWACQVDNSDSVNVDIYVKHEATNEEILIATGLANQTSEQGIVNSCGQAGSYRFSIEISQSNLDSYPNFKVFAYGKDELSGDGRGTQMLLKSGQVVIPSN